MNVAAAQISVSEPGRIHLQWHWYRNDGGWSGGGQQVETFYPWIVDRVDLYSDLIFQMIFFCDVGGGAAFVWKNVLQQNHILEGHLSSSETQCVTTAAGSSEDKGFLQLGWSAAGMKEDWLCIYVLCIFLVVQWICFQTKGPNYWIENHTVAILYYSSMGTKHNLTSNNCKQFAEILRIVSWIHLFSAADVESLLKCHHLLLQLLQISWTLAFMWFF